LIELKVLTPEHYDGYILVHYDWSCIGFNQLYFQNKDGVEILEASNAKIPHFNFCLNNEKENLLRLVLLKAKKHLEYYRDAPLSDEVHNLEDKEKTVFILLSKNHSC
jgi:hypothetical protein